MEDNYWDDLAQVGPQKPLGYLPRSTITDLCGETIAGAIAWAKQTGLRWANFDADECDINSGAIYVWHEAALASLLRAHAGLLAECGWPTDPASFVATVANNFAADDRPLRTGRTRFRRRSLCGTLDTDRFGMIVISEQSGIS